MSTVIEFDYKNRSYIEVLEERGVFAVLCGDYVANVWREEFPTLSLALLRVAVLVKCGEHEFEQMFAKDPETFARRGDLFLNGEVI